MYHYEITIPIRSAHQVTDLATFQSNWLAVDGKPGFCGLVSKNLDCVPVQGLGVKLMFNLPVPPPIERVREMIKALPFLQFEIKWLGNDQTGLVIGRQGTVTHECIIVPVPSYANEEACLI